ncbi:MAG: hypothetical protein A3B08_02360 [Candidatus Taylorbacteria bacterium RIFCSPLOWO2_01_FULL_43_44]|nr:MAG: hypothetical protein A2743_02715 [Candidatus Taylorbacteria bacterium RIFCSPHIGHO2_01_FULL_43_47]OHA31915.1 MAG: hypothetical protein A3B08_02360 [Candidatus Taylorbacteria bacterium RIFCSPLOWO2_01_FULL_43_44]
MKNKTVTQEESEHFFDFWSQQKNAIRRRVSTKTADCVNLYTAPDNVGYEFGQLRPGKLGQWDLFHTLTGPQSQNICDENETMIACGLTATEVAEEVRREHYLTNGVNPDDKFAVVAFERVNRMSPEELDSEIRRLEIRLSTAGHA